jgi:hypothetical protein
MITIQNKTFNEISCVRHKEKNLVKNESLDKTKHGYNFGFSYRWDIILEGISQEELEYLEDLERFKFTDDRGQKSYARIFENISIDDKYYWGDIPMYSVSLVIEEALT